jgi:alpha-beta hydrolase superfamily lysophospholipase
MSDYLSVNFPVGGIDGFGPAPTVAGWLFAPRDRGPGEIRRVAFCIHGGGYDKRYFHVEVPGRDDYSQCRYFADRGVIAVTIDCLGTGESSRAERAEFVTSQRLASAHHLAAGQLVAGLKAGTLVPELPPLPHIALTGIGHSLGGSLTIVQQAAHRSFDRVAILGWSNLGLNLDPRVLKPVFDPSGTYAYSSPELRRAFHMSDVPADVLDCPAEQEVSPVSLTLAAEAADRDTIRRTAGSIEAPVFVAFGESDTSLSPRAEGACYASADDVTFFLLAGSAHCHNFAGTRTVLWDRLLRWMG